MLLNSLIFFLLIVTGFIMF
jgi:hypothetical protein